VRLGQSFVTLASELAVSAKAKLGNLDVRPTRIQNNLSVNPHAILDLEWSQPFERHSAAADYATFSIA